MYHLVYLTRNLINNKIYVGKHSTWKEDDGYLGSGIALIDAINKYGKENFKRIILHYCYDKQQAYELEAQIVDISFVARRNTYNLTIGGKGVKLQSEKTKRNVSESNKIRIVSNETRKKMSDSHKGKIRSEEYRRNISKSLTGQTRSEERRNKISETLKERNRQKRINQKEIRSLL
jgi:hypothetical protein